MARVLVVDDMAFMRNLIRVVLEEEGMEIVTTADNGTAGVEAYKEYQPDVVLMNVRMPILDGIGATEQIIEHDPDATVIMCTGNRQEAKMQEAVKAGATDYITKPFQRDALVGAIEDAVED